MEAEKMKKILKRSMALLIAVIMLVTVSSVSVSAEVGDYTKSEVEGNNTPSTADRIYNDYTVTGSAGYENDMDYFKFTLSGYSKVIITCVADYSHLLLGIVDSSNEVYAAGIEDYTSSGTPSDSLVVSLSAGTYYVLLFNKTESPSYTYPNEYMFYINWTSSSSAHTHSYSGSVVSPTCSAQGYTVYTCSCGDSYKDNYVSATGLHNVENWSFLNETQHQGVCTDCQQTVKADHIFNDFTDAVCDDCEWESTSSCDHNWQSATCNSPKTCTVCGKTSGSKLNHILDNGTVTKKATCSQTGTKIYKCTVCKCIVKTETIAKLNTHTYKITTAKATLSKNGSIVKKCTVCGKNGGKTEIYYPKTIKLSATSYAYNGKIKTPTVTVKSWAGKALKKNTDFTITYASGRKNVGKYAVTIKFKGNYSGTKKLYFNINPTTKSKINLLIGVTSKIGAKSNKAIKYISSNPQIAKVDAKGKITAIKKGTATISVKSNGVTSKITVNVQNPSIGISASKKSIFVGDSLKLTAKTNPKNAKVSWSVNNRKIASISSAGKLKALSNGTVTVTGSFKYKGKTYKSTYKIKITVDYPDVSIFITEDSDYSSAYGFTITNNSGSSLKVIGKGYVYCDGTSEDIESLYIGDGKFYNWVSLKAGGSSTMVASLEDKMLFLSIDTVYMNIYLQYKGETFIAKCRSNIYGMNRCYEISWIKD